LTTVNNNSMVKNMEQLVRIKTIADLTGLSIRTIRRYVDSGKIRSYRSGANNYRMFRLKEAEEDFRKLHLVK